MKKNPISPHLQIYKIQITSALSILHRLSGIILTSGLFLLPIFLFVLYQGEKSFDCFKSIFQKAYLNIATIGLVFALHYHAFNGIRYWIWTKGYGISIPFVTQSGWIVLFLSILFTVFFYQ